jgi:alanine racemase
MAVAPDCWLDISVSNFTGNVALAKAQLAGSARLMIAVKSDAYGHGGTPLALAAVEAGADALAVLDITTGISLREALPEIPMLAWLLSPHDDFRAASVAGLTLGISHLWQLEKLAAESQGRLTTVHLKVDTGLHRNGCLPEHWPALVAKARSLETSGLITVQGVWSHLADTSLDEDRISLQRFHEAVEIARAAGLSPSILHIAASAAANDVPEARLDMVRIGISVFGVSPFDDRSALDLGFAPVMAARARITSLDEGRKEITVGMGFADGLMPLAPDTGWVALGGQRVPVKSVEVDHCVVGWPALGAPALGEIVTLFGDTNLPAPRAEDWAQWAGTIGDEVVSAMPKHLTRNYLSA